MPRIAVMGDKDSICGFAALGVEIYPAEEASSAIEILRNLLNNDCAVIYITEGLASKISEEISKYKGRITPAIILIPGMTGNTGAGMASVKRTVEKAVGSDILN